MARFRLFVVYLGYRSSAVVMGVLPRRIAMVLGAGLGRTMSHLSRTGRKTVADNLRRIVGPDVTARDLNKLVGRAYAAYGHYWVDFATIRSSNKERVDSWIMEGEEYFRAALSKGRGVVIVLPHLGSWEAGGIWAMANDSVLTTVAEPAEPAQLFEWFTKRRNAVGLKVLPLGPKASPELLRILRSGGAIALLADRDIAGDGIEVEFFGARTRVPAGPALLALRSGAAIVPVALYFDGTTRHCVVRPPIDTTRTDDLRGDVQRISQAIASQLEEFVRVAPEQWHVFQPHWLDQVSTTTTSS